MLNIKNENMYIKILFSIFIFVLVVLAVLGRNVFDYVYIGIIFIFIIEKIRK